jgi:phage-related protein
MKYSIYEIDEWVGETAYEKDDIIKVAGIYYYALYDHTSGPDFQTDLSLGKWGGQAVSEIGESKPHFIWTPSYGLPIDIEPKIINIQFGNGYQQRIADGINNNLLVLNLKFEGLTLQQVTAISHFLYTRGGTESFLFIPPKPFHKLKKFVVRKFSPSLEFYQNNPITVTFEEVVN